MVIDATTRLIHWEKMNVAFIEEQGIGTVNREVRELPHIVSQHLFDGVYRTGIKHNIAAFEKKIFRDQFKMLISEIAS
jgi:hemin uptake protein HemP